ncbi:hypothetical protein JCM3770_004482, partial [Rhodotorula araucariae]
MPVGHRRFNNPNADPNDSITFIRVLQHLPDAEQAQKILDALAAQFKPIMKQWGFGVNSLVEHEWNPTFAGRNWNAGEIVEIVLRRKDGSFAPYQFLLYVMCHELAHIREMNHSWAFQQVNTQLRQALTALRARGYYGDGFWSTGRSLAYPAADAPLAPADEPTYTCGGANRSRRRRRRRDPSAAAAGPSKPRGAAAAPGRTGRQTAIAPKAGGRVQRKGAFPEGEGARLSEDPDQSSFRRRAQAKDAVAARAAAAEARLAAERRAKAAEAHTAGSQSPAKPRVKREQDGAAAGVLVLDSDSDGDGGDDVSAGGWETDDEDKPEVKLEAEEKRFLKEDMRAWRGAFPAAAAAAAAAPEGGGAEGQAEDVKPCIGAERKGKGKAPVARKRRASPSASPSLPPAAAGSDDLAALGLTAEERAWLAAEAHPSAEGDGERVGKRSRVCDMAMPEWMGGTAGGKGNAWASRNSPSAPHDSDVEIISDSEDDARAAPQTGSSRRKRLFAAGSPTQRSPNLAPPPKGKNAVAPRGGIGSKARGKGEGKAEKKPRKTRSDKGVKRGPRKKPPLPLPLPPPAHKVEVAVDPLERIRRERDRDDYELDWTDEEPAAMRAHARKPASVVVVLELRAARIGVAVPPRTSADNAAGSCACARCRSRSRGSGRLALVERFERLHPPLAALPLPFRLGLGVAGAGAGADRANARLAAKRQAREADSSRRIHVGAEAVQREGAARAPGAEGALRTGGWGGNVLIEGIE